MRGKQGKVKAGKNELRLRPPEGNKPMDEMGTGIGDFFFFFLLLNDIDKFALGET